MPHTIIPPEIALAQQSIAGWASLVTRGAFKVYPHVAFLVREIHQAIREGYNLLIEAPPRHGKSWLVSRFLPGWYLGRFPGKPVIHASYGLALSKRFGRQIKADIEGYGRPVFDIELDPSSKAAHEFEIKGYPGAFFGVGIGGGLTGRGGSLLISDDTMKGAKEAKSEVQIESLQDWIDTVFGTRREPGAIHIGIQTPWVENDLHGYLLDKRGDQYKHIRLPALAEEDDVLGREVGAALCPARYTREYLERERDAMPSLWWSAMYQCRPSPEEGAIWKRPWWSARYRIEEDASGNPIYRIGDYSTPLSSCSIFMASDMAFSEKRSADYTAIGVFALTPERPHRMLILDFFRERIPAPEYIPQLKRMARQWKAKRIYLERAGQQIGQIQYARKAGLAPMTIGRANDDDVQISGDKDAVHHEASPFARNGRLIPPESAPWWDIVEHELLTYPNAAHDDAADVIAFGCHIAQLDSYRTRFKPQPDELEERREKRKQERERSRSIRPNRPSW